MKRASRFSGMPTKPRRSKLAVAGNTGARRLFFESLEERRVLSTLAVTSAVAGQLTITDLGDLANKNDSLAMSFNSDIGDSWEWADEPQYPEKYSALGIRIGVNYVIYSMTH